MESPLLLATVRTTAALISALSLQSGCSATNGGEAKQGYYVDQNSNVHYQFADASGTHFGANCHDRPVLVLTDANYSQQAKQFELTVDGRSWNLEAFNGKHGNALIVIEPSIINAVANAKRSFSYRVGDWKRTLSPTPLVAQWLANCRNRQSKNTSH